MKTWLRRFLRRPDPGARETPDIVPFIARARASRAETIDDRRASERVTRQLRRESRDFAETMRVPPIWRQGRDAR